MAELGQKERIKKAIDFFRKFPELSDKELYRKSVLRFCDMVESELGLKKKDEFDKGKVIFTDVV